MTERYFSETPLAIGRAVLAGAEAHHLIHVMRARPGTEVTLLDGSGAEFPSCVERIGRSEAELQVLRRVEVDRELPFQVVLGVALPKGDRQRWLVEKATELGCAKLVPLRTERSVAEPTAGAPKRLHRAVIEACKQCGRNRLMEIAPAADWPAFLASPSPQAWRLLAHPAVPSGEHNRQADASRAESLPPPATAAGRRTHPGRGARGRFHRSGDRGSVGGRMATGRPGTADSSRRDRGGGAVGGGLLVAPCAKREPVAVM